MRGLATGSLYAGLLLSLLGLVAVMVDSLLGGSSAANLARLVAGLVMLAEGTPLALNWRRARQLLTERLLEKLGRSGRMWRWLVGPLLIVLALVFLGFGALEVLRAAQSWL